MKKLFSTEREIEQTSLIGALVLTVLISIIVWSRVVMKKLFSPKRAIAQTSLMGALVLAVLISIIVWPSGEKAPKPSNTPKKEDTVVAEDKPITSPTPMPKSSPQLVNILATAGGNGSKIAPYKIATTEQFASFRDAVNLGYTFDGMYFILGSNIDLSDYSPWEPIGVMDTNKYFYGYFDGNGYAISNLTIVQTVEDTGSMGNKGLFGWLKGTVYNLGIASGNVSGSCVGTIASHGVGKIVNCYSYADITAAFRAGGIADNFGYSVIANCAYFGTINAASVGYSYGNINSYAAALYNCVSVAPFYPENEWYGTSTNAFADTAATPREGVVTFLNSNLTDAEYLAGLDDGTLIGWTVVGGRVVLANDKNQKTVSEVGTNEED